MDKFLARCENCTELNVKNNVYFCKECFNQKCNEIDDCPLGVKIEEIQTLEEKAKENKQNKHIYTKRESKPREKKLDTEKIEIIKKLASFLENDLKADVEITNESKIIKFKYENTQFTLDLIRTRVKKEK